MSQQEKAAATLTVKQGNNDLFAFAHKSAWQADPFVKVPVSLRQKQQLCLLVLQHPGNYVVLGKLVVRRNRLRRPAAQLYESQLSLLTATRPYTFTTLCIP